MRAMSAHRLVRCVAAALLGAILVPVTPAVASHMRDFLVADTAYVASAGETWLISSQDATWRSENHAFLLTPGLMHGLTDWLTIGVDAEVSRLRGESFRYEATRPYLQLRVTPARSALAAGVRIDYLTNHRSGMENEVRSTALVSYTANEWTYTLAAQHQRETTAGGFNGWQLSGGLRAQVSPRVAYGLETRSALYRRGSTEVLLGAYLDPTPQFSFHVGVGSGIVRGPGAIFRSELIWRAQ